MKIFICVVLSLQCLIGLGQETRKLPSVGISTLQGDVVQSDEIKNDKGPILIIFWATWCHHATDGMTSISDEYIDDWIEEYNLKVVTISVDDSRNLMKVQPLVNGKGWEFEHYLDPNSDFKRAMGVNDPPHLFIVNGKREIIWSFNSFNPGDESEIEKILKDLKKEQ